MSSPALADVAVADAGKVERWTDHEVAAGRLPTTRGLEMKINSSSSASSGVAQPIDEMSIWHGVPELETLFHCFVGRTA